MYEEKEVSPEDRQKAMDEISKLVQEMQNKVSDTIHRCTEIAEENGLHFSTGWLDLPDMLTGDWDSRYDMHRFQWQSSSMNC